MPSWKGWTEGDGGEGMALLRGRDGLGHAHSASRRPVQMGDAYRKIAREYDPRCAKRLVRLGWRISKRKRAGV